MRFSAQYVESYSADTGFPVKNFTSRYIADTDKNRVRPKSANVTYDVPLNNMDYASSRFVDVSKDLYDMIIEGYTPQYARVYIDEYPYVSDVMNELFKKGYNVMSPYLASSAEYDSDKVNQRSNSLIISISTILSTYVLLLVFFIIVMQMKKKEEKVMLYQGASKQLLNRFNFVDLFSSMIISLIISLSAYLIIKNTNDYLKEAFKYVRLYHFLIIIGVVIAVTFVATIIHERFISYSNVKGGE